MLCRADPGRPAVGGGALQTDRGAHGIGSFGLQAGITDIAIAITEPADHPARHRTAAPAVAFIDGGRTALARIAQFQGRLLAQRITDKRSEEHTSELQSLMRISYAVFCLKQKI